MKTINLEEILDNEKLDLSDFDKRHILNAMKEACDQTVDLCAENVEVNTISAKVWVEKDSIIHTKFQINYSINQNKKL